MKISKPGFDVKTTDEKNLTILSTSESHKVAKSGILISTDSLTVTHGRGAPTINAAYKRNTSGRVLKVSTGPSNNTNVYFGYYAGPLSVGELLYYLIYEEGE